jgi:hypothetical protein
MCFLCGGGHCHRACPKWRTERKFRSVASVRRSIPTAAGCVGTEKKDRQCGKQHSGHQVFTGCSTALKLATPVTVIAAPSPEVAKSNDRFVKTMKTVRNKGTNDGKMITIITTLQHIMMGLWTAGREADLFAIIMNAVYRVTYEEAGTWLRCACRTYEEKISRPVDEWKGARRTPLQREVNTSEEGTTWYRAQTVLHTKMTRVGWGSWP